LQCAKFVQDRTLRQLKPETEKYSIAITAIKEIKWKGKGIVDTENVTMFYSGSTEINVIGTGFLVHKKYTHE
jgi:hypothetical protein